jgi:hypothetical protein
MQRLWNVGTWASTSQHNSTHLSVDWCNSLLISKWFWLMIRLSWSKNWSSHHWTPFQLPTSTQFLRKFNKFL